MAILGVDVGGTFTDFYLISDDGSIGVYKRPSTRDDPARGMLEGMREMGASPEEVVHGSTVATNVIIERKGARTGLITTRGFRDVLLIGRQTRPRLYDLSPQREPPLVPDDLRLEANERLDYLGEVLQPLDAGEVERLLDEAQALGIESLAVCFLFSFLNNRHERRVAEAARRRGLPVTASYEVLPEHREYERTSTTVANAYVMPVMSRYLARLSLDLRARGTQRLRIMASNGGSISPRAAGRLAVRTALSGPAGGVAGAFALARQAGLDHIITLDMGGTSTDVSLCPGRILQRDETLVGAFPVRGPTVDVISVGAGGGSIARIDESGALRVGPESAGADPGPACYGRGEQATVTDAQVALGRIASEHFLDGRMSLREDLSALAITRLSGPYSGDVDRTAAAVLRVANAGMEHALRIVSVERGYDPRLFTLVAFGGAGPLHACDLAEALSIPRVLVPRYPGVLSALGMATAPIVKDVAAAVMRVFETGGAQRDAGLRRVFADLEGRARKELREEGFSPDGATVARVLDMRYMGQSYELAVSIDEVDPAHINSRFHAAHRERYAHWDESRPVEVVTARVKLALPAPIVAQSNASKRQRVVHRAAGHRSAWFGKRLGHVPVFAREALKTGAQIAGPAIITQMDATTAVNAAWRGLLDGWGNLVLERVVRSRANAGH